MSLYLFSEDGRELSVMMTEACNSSCIMCPMSPGLRMRGNAMTDAELDEIISLLNEDIRHIDITGGEPFLQWQQVIRLMAAINARCPRTSVLVLTNGRALSIPAIQNVLCEVLTEQYQFAIPIHAGTPALHDRITQAPGSFDEAMAGLRFLSGTCANIEIRIVGHRLNAAHLQELVRTLLDRQLRIHVVNLIAMEMHGTAARNRDMLWIDYDELFHLAQPALLTLLMHQVDVALYDFPLCCLPVGYWSLAKKSISEWKVEYPAACDQCIQKHACGGLFESTNKLKLCKVKPFTGR